MQIFQEVLNGLTETSLFFFAGFVLILLFVAVYGLGRSNERKRWEMAKSVADALAVPSADAYAEIQVDVLAEELVTAAIDTIQIAYLEPTTAPIELISISEPDTGSIFTVLPDLEEPVPTESMVDAIIRERDELLLEVQELKADLEVSRELVKYKEALRAKWYRILRVERQRVRYAFHSLMVRPRRPSRQDLLAQRIDVAGSQVRLLPRPMAMEWREQMAA